MIKKPNVIVKSSSNRSGSNRKQIKNEAITKLTVLKIILNNNFLYIERQKNIYSNKNGKFNQCDTKVG